MAIDERDSEASQSETPAEKHAGGSTRDTSDRAPENAATFSNPAPSDPKSAVVAGENAPTVIVRKHSVIKRTSHVLLWLIASVLGIAILALVFTQLPVFRNIIVHELVKTVEESTNGTLVIGNVEGNILTGFVMNDVTLKLKSGTRYDSIDIFHAEHILAKYSLIRYLRRNEIGVVNMVIQRPTFRLVKYAGDTTWNYSMLFKPVATAPSGPPKPFTQIVDLQSFRIQDGTLLVRDYNFPERETKEVGGVAEVKEREVDFADLQMEHIDLDSRLYARGNAAQSFSVNHLRFSDRQSGFFVQHLQFDGYLDNIQARMDNALITTGHSDLTFSLELTPPSIISTGLVTSLEKSSLYLVLKGPTISTYELKQFLPHSLGFLSGSPGIDLTTHGQFGLLHIDHLGLDFKGHGSINIAGDLKNLQTPDKLWMDLALSAQGLSNTTLTSYVPGLHIPNLSRLGVVSIPHLTYVGEPVDFHTVLDVRTSGAGNIAGVADLDFRNIFRYKGDFRTQNLNIANVLNNEDWKSNITSNLKIDGVGTEWRTMSAAVSIKTNAPSSFSKYAFTNLDMAGTFKRGVAAIDHLDGALVGGPVAHIRSALVDFKSSQFIYAFDGTVTDFQLAKYIPSFAGNPARVDVDANLRGAGKDLEDVTGTVHAKLYDLAFQGRKFDPVKIDATLSPSRSGNNALAVTSDIVDIHIDNRWKVRDLVKTIPDHISAFLTAVDKRYFPSDTAAAYTSTTCRDSVDMDYYIRIKDLRPLASFVPKTFLLAEGVLQGNVAGCPQGDLSLVLEADSMGVILRDREAKADTLHYVATDSTVRPDSLHRTDSSALAALALPKFGAGTPRVHITPTTFRLEARNLPLDPHHVFSQLDATLNFASDSVIRIGSALLFKPHVNLAYQRKALSVDVSTVYNDVLGLRVKGSSHFPNGDLDVTLDSLRLAYLSHVSGKPEEYIWMNETPTHILVEHSGRITVDTMNLVHPMANFDPTLAFAQRLSFGGSLNGDSISAWASVPKFNLTDIPKLVPLKPNSKTLKLTQFEGTVRQMSVSLTGTLQKPEMAARLNIRGLQYDGVTFDTTFADLSYHDQAIRGSVLLHVDTATFNSDAFGLSDLPFNFSLSGANEFRAQIDSIPMLIAFKRGPTYHADSLAILSRPLSARVNASKFPISIATPFIPAFSELNGTGDIHFAVTGTQQDIQYGGFATVKDGSFLLTPNNMYYLFDGTVLFRDNVLRLEDMTVRNVPADDPQGEAKVNGFFNFSGFTITSFDLALRTNRLSVMSNASRTTLKSFYGPLSINTGDSNFHFMNTFDAPWLKGKINVLHAFITMPQSDNATQAISTEGIVYRIKPNDSLERLRRFDTAVAQMSASQQLARAVNSGSVRMVAVDDSLFSNSMKDIYRTEAPIVRDTIASTAVHGETAVSPLQPTFAQKLRYDLQLGIQGDVWVVVPFNGIFGLLGAQLSAEIRTDGNILAHRGDDLRPEIIGDLDLTPNSTFRFYQTFNITQGRISFRQDFNDPEINVVAEYVGPHVGKDNIEDEVKLQLVLTGTKSKIGLHANIFTRGAAGVFERRPYTDEEGKEQVIYYLASGGSFKEDLSEAGQIAVIQKAASSIGSQLLSTMVSNLLGSSGTSSLIRSASLRLGSNVGLQLTAVYRNVTLRYSTSSGGIGDPLKADYIIDVPFNTIAPFGAARNMLLEFQLHTDESHTYPGSPAEQPLFLAKWLYRIPF